MKESIIYLEKKEKKRKEDEKNHLPWMPNDICHCFNVWLRCGRLRLVAVSHHSTEKDVKRHE